MCFLHGSIQHSVSHPLTPTGAANPRLQASSAAEIHTAGLICSEHADGYAKWISGTLQPLVKYERGGNGTTDGQLIRKLFLHLTPLVSVPSSKESCNNGGLFSEGTVDVMVFCLNNDRDLQNVLLSLILFTGNNISSHPSKHCFRFLVTGINQKTHFLKLSYCYWWNRWSNFARKVRFFIKSVTSRSIPDSSLEYFSGSRHQNM